MEKHKEHKGKSRKWLWILGAIFLVFILAASYIYINFFMPSPLASLVIEQGNVQYMMEGNDWKPASNGMTLKQGYSIKTLADSRANIIFSYSVMRLDSNSEVSLDELAKESISMTQSMGSTWSRLLKISGIKSYEVSTPEAIASVRGTGFAVYYDGKTMELKVSEGTVNFGSEENSKDVPADKQAEVGEDGTMKVEDLQSDDWIAKNLQLDEQHKQEVKQHILKKYGYLINVAKSQYGISDEKLDQLFDEWYSGKISVKQKIESGEIPSEFASMIPEEFKRY